MIIIRLEAMDRLAWISLFDGKCARIGPWENVRGRLGLVC
jgi:hypothetical protein